MDDIRCMVYIGMPDNPQFMGALKPADVAKKINESRGPSGENREYLLQLEEALSSLSSESGDEHVSDLARRVRAMAPVERGERMVGIEEHPLHKVGSTEEQEEIEKES
jgi:cation transport protein ChaC